MTTQSFLNLSDVCSSLEFQQEMITQKINHLITTLNDGKRWAGNIGDQLVYLKFYTSSSFQTEKEIMLRHGFSAYDSHRQQHDEITEELRYLLEQIVSDGVSMSMIIDAGKRLLNRLQMHIAQHDRELIIILDKDRRQAQPVKHKEDRTKEYATFMDLHCHTA